MEMTIKTSQIAENIRKIRLMFNLTQLEMADKLGYSERQIRRLESNGTSNLEVVNLISTTFNISAWDILASRMSWFVFIGTFRVLTLIFFVAYTIGVVKEVLIDEYISIEKKHKAFSQQTHFY